MTNIVRDTGWHPPVFFAPTLDASAANIRGASFSTRFLKPYLIRGVSITFEDNTNDSCRCRLYVCNSNTTRPVVADTVGSAGTTVSAGQNLFAGGGLEYVTGDGPNPIDVPIGLEVAGGFYLAVDIDNQDTPNVHAVRVRFDVSELI
jgi:hypothetical protein